MKKFKKILSISLAVLLLLATFPFVSSASEYDEIAPFVGRDELYSAETSAVLINNGGMYGNDCVYFAEGNIDPSLVYKVSIGNTLRFMVMDYDVGGEVNYTVFGSDDCENWSPISSIKNRYTDFDYVTSYVWNNDGSWSVSGYVVPNVEYSYIKICAPVNRNWASQIMCVQVDNDAYIPAYGTAKLEDAMYASPGVSALDWFGGTLMGPWPKQSAEHGKDFLPYVSYKIPYGGYVNFSANIPNSESGEFTAYRSDDGLNWFPIALNISTNPSAVDGSWKYVEYSTGKIFANYVKICFGSVEPGTSYLLQYVGGSRENVLLGTDLYYSTSAAISNKVDFYTNNIITSGNAWDENIYDSLFPNWEVNYFENGVRHNGYISYKVLPNSNVKAVLYEYVDNTVSYNWAIQVSDNGYEWENVEFTRNVTGRLINNKNEERPFDIVELSALATKQYLRIVFPFEHWYGSLHSFSAFPNDSYTVSGKYDFAARDAEGDVLLSDGSKASVEISSLGDLDYIKYDASKIIALDGIETNHIPGWKIKADSIDGAYTQLVRKAAVDSSAIFKVSADKDFRAEILSISGALNLSSSVKLYATSDFESWTPVDANYFETDVKSYNSYYSLWYVDALELPEGCEYIKIVLSNGDDNLASWAPQIISIMSDEITSEFGDINWDGVVDVRDMIRLKKFNVQLVSNVKVNPMQLDLDFDGQTDSADLVALRKILLSK